MTPREQLTYNNGEPILLYDVVRFEDSLASHAMIDGINGGIIWIQWNIPCKGQRYFKPYGVYPVNSKRLTLLHRANEPCRCARFLDQPCMNDQQIKLARSMSDTDFNEIFGEPK